MKLLHYSTYNSWPVGIDYNRFSKGWHFTLCYSFFGKKYILQLRRDI